MILFKQNKLKTCKEWISGLLFVLLFLVFSSPFAHAQTVTYAYDTCTKGVGRLCSVADPSGSSSFTYDQRGNTTQTVKVIEGNSYTTQSAYDSLGRVKTLTYPGGEGVTHTYDFSGSLKTVVGNQTYVSNISYNAFGQRTSMNLGNGTTTTYSYDPNHFRMNNLTTIQGATTLQNLGYTYDNVGNVKNISDGITSSYSQSFTYDHLNRLETANSSGLYGSITYAYNQIGNMTCNSRISACSAASPNYSYPSSGPSSIRPHAVTQAGTNTYSYDANGNMTSGAGKTISYDQENRPISIDYAGNITAMAYDYSGDRVKKAFGSTTTYYVGTLHEEVGNDTANFIFAGSTRVAMRRSDGTLLYYHGNHLGSTHIVTNASGNQVEEIHYEPFGKTFTDSGTFDVNHKYTSQEFDSETDLYYYRARYYDPELGRFIQADSTAVSLRNPQTFNRYSYVLNNPLRYTDPTGNFECEGFLGCIGAGLSAIGDAIVSGIQAVGNFFSDLFGFGGEGDGLGFSDESIIGGTSQQGAPTTQSRIESELAAKFKQTSNENSCGGTFSPACGGAQVAGLFFPCANCDESSIIDIGPATVIKKGGAGILQNIFGIRGNKGDFNVGSMSAKEARALGESFVGPNQAPIFKGGKEIGFRSEDNLRVFREPALKQRGQAAGQTQANIEEFIVDEAGKRVKIRNAHINILP